jgi:hypothetical protein
MSTFAKVALAAVAVVASASSAAMAGSDARYVVRRISNGPRPTQYMLVRVDRGDQPYALMGTESGTRAHRTAWATPTHPKGPQSAY